jgi:hypothetical protein
MLLGYIDDDTIDKMVEMKETRNLLLHNDLIINNVYPIKMQELLPFGWKKHRKKITTCDIEYFYTTSEKITTHLMDNPSLRNTDAMAKKRIEGDNLVKVYNKFFGRNNITSSDSLFI